MNWMHYLVEANLYLAAFYALYLLFLRSETHYQLNRVYLLGTSAVAFVIPLVQLGVLKPATQITGQILAGNLQGTYSTMLIAPPEPKWTTDDYILLAYGVVALALFIHLLIRVYLLLALLKKGSVTKNSNFNIVELQQHSTAFSFFNNLFIDDKLASSQTVLYHEQVHIRQKHSWDIIYLELLKIINWFNPVVYLLIASIKEVHEFIADEETARIENNNDNYTDFLISNAYGISQNSLTNSFFNKNLLKRRITMLYQKRSGKAARLKYLLTLPLVAGLLCISTLAFTTKTYGLVDLAPVNNNAIAKHAAEMEFNQKSQPLIMVNNKVFKIDIAADFDFNNARQPEYAKLLNIPRAEIKSVAKLEPKIAIALYGKQGNNGAVLINTGKYLPTTTDTSTKTETKLPKNGPKQNKAGKVFTAVEVQPEFPGGEAGLGKFIQKNIHYPAADKKNGIQGKVYIQFIVGANGSLYGYKVLRSPSEAMKEEAIRVMKLSPKWQPGIQNGKAVNVQFTLPINFSLGYQAPTPPPPPPAKPSRPSADAPAIPGPPPAKMDRPAKADEVYTAVEVQPEFPGGQSAFGKFLQQNIHYPKEAKDKKVQGKVYVQFVVEKDGSISNIKTMREPGAGTGEEAARVMGISPKWIPGTQNGQPVRVQFTLPITFSLGASK